MVPFRGTHSYLFAGAAGPGVTGFISSLQVKEVIDELSLPFVLGL